ncbi:1-acyl-sn-glycerol-3-phosphate acyltransferase [Campylobacter sputorum]|uniref:1-acyl-sn-glycerol-3-phosphate acyltransferase n=1 Tax=Campylobacter sputorum TaxID=206 RepID=UPI001F21EFCD|nr:MULTISPECIES: 1-acyl-sn-glycerol-3-phosphate acyltransferase [Campylobacter]
MNNVLKYFDFSYDCKFKENIPKKGKVVFVANHPLGSLDALCLISLIYSIRQDIKILANELLYELKPLREVLFSVDNLGQKKFVKYRKKSYFRT